MSVETLKLKDNTLFINEFIFILLQLFSVTVVRVGRLHEGRYLHVYY